MLHILKRHPIPVVAHFDHSIVLTYSFDENVLKPLLPPGLVLDTYEGSGFVAIALVQTKSLRPAFLPKFLGRDFFLAGYRIFTKHKSMDGTTRRGLRILRSDTNRRTMAFFGNLLTHYNYKIAEVELRDSKEDLIVNVDTKTGEGDLDVTVHLNSSPESPPAGSPFPDFEVARRFAGPLPFTFDYEEQTHSIIRIKGVRSEWRPRPVDVDVRRVSFFDKPPFNDAEKRLANAFHLRNVPYRWERGVRERLSDEEG